MDVRIDNEQGKFKFRVCGILEYKNKYLAVKMNENDFFCLPGGHVELGEDTNTAILREMKEELDFEVKIKKLVAINQNFFKNSKNLPFHEIGFYYLVEATDESKVNENDFVRDELDKGKIQHLVFKWFSQEELKTIDFRPKFVSEILKNETPAIIITRDEMIEK